jgi:signal transduction histidine kinase
MLGRHVLTTHSPNNPAGLDQEIFSRTLAGGWAGEVLFSRKDGSEYPVFLTTAPVRDEQGKIVALIGIVRDITEHKRLEETILRANQELGKQVADRTADLEAAKLLAEAANRAKSEFLANMSHELRTPLNSILGFVDIIRDGMAGPTTDSQREYLGDVMDSSRHLLSLINDILDLSKVEAGHTELELSSFAVADLVEHSLVLFKEKAMKHGITLAVDLADDIGEIRADERKIKQVLVNLLANAMKFTQDGGRVAVTAARDDDGIRITVQDTGIGIAQKDLPKLFQPFQQLETALAKKYPGTGLGLSLCRKFVELHGGRIWVESELGAGSSFIFVLPEEPIIAQLPQHNGAGEDSVLAGTKILAWQAGRQHLNRLFSLGSRESVAFTLLRFQFGRSVSRDDFLAAAITIQKMIREHDLVMADADQQRVWLAIMGVERGISTETLCRFRELPGGATFPFEVAAAFFPDDGDTIDDLVAALDSPMTLGPQDDPTGEPR